MKKWVDGATEKINLSIYNKGTFSQKLTELLDI